MERSMFSYQYDKFASLHKQRYYQRHCHSVITTNKMFFNNKQSEDSPNDYKGMLRDILKLLKTKKTQIYADGM